MTAIAGVVALDGGPADPERLERLMRLAPGNAVDVLDTWIEGSVGFSCALTRISPESRSARRPVVDPASGVVAMLDGRIDNRSELQAALGVDGAADDATYVLGAHLEWDAGAASRLLGDYATAVWDPRSVRLLIACDPVGIRPLYYAVEDGLLLFASTLEQLLEGLDAAPAVDDDVALTFLYRPLLDWPRTSFLRGVESLRGGELLEVGAGVVSRRRYWSWPDSPPERDHARGDEPEEFRALVEDAVRVRLRSTSPTAIYLSGGLDSGAVASVAGRQRRDDPSLDVRAYTCVFDRFTTIDERSYGEAVTDAYSLPHTLIASDGCWTLSAIDPWLPVFNEPLLGPYEAMNYRALPIIRDDGCRTLLTGRGGDVLFMGTARYFASWLLHGRWGPLREQLQRKRPTSRHGYAYQFAAWALFPLTPAAAQRAMFRRQHSLDPLKRWMPPPVAARYRANPPHFAAAGLHGWWQDRRDDVDELTRTPMTAYFDRLMRLHGLESRHPLLDRRLIEFALRAPPDVFFRDGISRWIFIEALRDVIPPLVRDRRDKTSAAPLLAYGLRERRAAFVRALLVDSELVQRDYVRSAPWREDVERYLAGDDSIPLWPSLSVELWLRHREGRLPPLD